MLQKIVAYNHLKNQLTYIYIFLKKLYETNKVQKIF